MRPLLLLATYQLKMFLQLLFILLIVQAWSLLIILAWLKNQCLTKKWGINSMKVNHIKQHTSDLPRITISCPMELSGFGLNFLSSCWNTEIFQGFLRVSGLRKYVDEFFLKNNFKLRAFAPEEGPGKLEYRNSARRSRKKFISSPRKTARNSHCPWFLFQMLVLLEGGNFF